jgi:hypothetical protein
MRRGQAEALEWLPRMILLTVAVIVIVMLVRTYVNRDASSAQTATAAYIYRLYYDDIIMYSDPVTKRVYPGIVDVEKFTTKNLDTVFVEKENPMEPSRMSAKIVLSSNGCGEHVIYNDKSTYEQYILFIGSDAGRSYVQSTIFPVTVRSGTMRCKGSLNITAVRPNS